MKKMMVFGMAAILISVVLWKSNTAAAEKNRLEETARINQKIHEATVMIVMVTPGIHETTGGAGTFLKYGMGTLVKTEGGVWLVTHNHFSEALEDLTIVELRDADGRMVKPMMGNEFKSLIMYQDPGTLVLRAPEILMDNLTPASLGEVSQVKAGEAVQVAYREGEKRDRAGILEAVIEEVTTNNNGVPVYKIHNPNGQVIQPGDSGGGVWHKGQLVGNMWWVKAISGQNATVTSGDTEQINWVLTDISYAAVIPVGVP